MSGSIVRFRSKDKGVEVPSAEGAMLRVPKDTPAGDRAKTLTVIRDARDLLEAEPEAPPYVPRRRPTISLTEP